mgnify:CR=1 FL=1
MPATNPKRAHTLSDHLRNRARGMSDPQDRIEALATVRDFFVTANAIPDTGDTEFRQLLSGMQEALASWWPSVPSMRPTPKASP